MSKTYDLTATLKTGKNLDASPSGDWRGYDSTNVNCSDLGKVGRESGPMFWATNMVFDSATLSTLRNKTVNGITLEIVVTQEVDAPGLIAWKYNSTASGNTNSQAWARSDNAGTYTAGDSSIATNSIPSFAEHGITVGTHTLTIKALPQYGLVAGPYSSSRNGVWKFSSATLHVTTNETDYTLSYNANNGSGAPASETKTGTTSYTFTISSTVPTRAGYDFLGWATSSSASTASYQPGGTIKVSSNTTLYAVWKIKTYTVSYNVNGGSGTFANQTKNYGGSFTIHSTKPTKASASAGSYTVTYNGNSGTPGVASQSAARTTSYTFSVWNTAQNGSGTSYAAGATYSANASATLYAQYTSSTTTASISLTSATRTGYTFNGWYTAASGGTRVGGAGSSYTPTGNVTLYAQWTASSATLSSVTSSVDCGNNLTGSWTSTGSTYKYKLKVTCGNAEETWSSLTAANASSATVQIPASWYSMDASLNGPLRDATSATATCTLYTYASDGTTQIGTTSSKTFTVKVPTSVVPSLGALSAASSSDNSVVSGWGSTTFVQGYSKVTLTQSVSSYNGSRFSSVRYSGPGLDSTKTGSLASSDASSVINSAGTLTYTATVTDTRGRSASKTVAVTFQPYAQPSIAGIAVQRCDSDGTVNNSAGAYFKATPVYSFSSVSSKNALVTQNIKYRVHPSGAWSTATTCASGSTYGPWSALLTNSYDVMVTLADRIQNGSSQTTTFTTTLPTVQGIWFGKGNDRLGLGGVPEGAGLYCDWDATFKGVVDVVPRRCYATLSSAGWYRVLKTADVSGTIIDLYIGRPYGNDPAETHKISIHIVGGGKTAFIGETSDANALCVDKIRLTYGGGFTYVDIHYNTSSSNEVLVYFNVYGKGQANGTSVSMNLTSVDASPSGETVLEEYTFVANRRKLLTTDIFRIRRTYSNITISSNNGYILLDSFANIGISSQNYCLGFNIVGWSGFPTYGFQIMRGSNGTDFYLASSVAGTFGSFTVEYWFADLSV